MKRNIRLVLAYDGTDFGGWQLQDNAPSVQGAVEAVLAKMHGRRVPLFAAGRTDSGVHAMGQVANFWTDIASIEAGRFVPALNKALPRSVRVLSAADADFDFHSRFDARLRRYRYFIAPGPVADPFTLRRAFGIRRRPDIGLLNEMASALLGETDFTALCSARDPSPSKRRHILESSFRWEGGLLVYEVAANAFLLRMVRSIVGSLLQWENGGGGMDSLREALGTGKRALAGPTAPACGLFFWNAEHYPEPRKPGRGAYWSSLSERGSAGSAGAAGSAVAAREGGAAERAEEDEEETTYAEIPEEPRGDFPPPGTRLVPGFGIIKE